MTERSEFETILLSFTLLVSLGCGWFYQRFIHSASGEALAGLKTNETRLEYLGLSAQKVLWVGYVISGLFLSLSGAIFALAQGLVTPDMGAWTRSGEFVFIMILGVSIMLWVRLWARPFLKLSSWQPLRTWPVCGSYCWG